MSHAAKLARVKAVMDDSNGDMETVLATLLTDEDAGEDPRATTYYVDTVDGSNDASGEDWPNAFLTMAEAFANVGSGGTIRFRGKVTEQLSTPVQVFDVTVIGDANKPRHADAVPASADGKTHGASWAPAGTPTADTALVRVRQQGWTFVNILFDGHSDSPCVQLFRDGGADDAERDASHATFLGCRFTGAAQGIEDSGGSGHHLISGCDFTSLTTAIANTAGAGIGQPWLRSQIKKCRFTDNTNDIDIPSQEVNIRDCTFTGVIDLTGGVGSNIVGPGNVFADTYNETTYKDGTNDIWAGNFTTAGITTANPAP